MQFVRNRKMVVSFIGVAAITVLAVLAVAPSEGTPYCNGYARTCERKCSIWMAERVEFTPWPSSYPTCDGIPDVVEQAGNCGAEYEFTLIALDCVKWVGDVNLSRSSSDCE